MKMKLKKGDMVIVVTGKDKGKTGSIHRVLPETNKVLVEGVAIAKRHTKGTAGKIGQIIEAPRPIAASNVMIYDGTSKKGTRVGRESRDGKLVRVTKKGGKVLA